jgi:dTDP-4-amino-4,6-dideoxygalactose transaminase
MNNAPVAVEQEAIPFNRVDPLGREYEYIAAAVAAGHLSCDGPFTARCQEWLCATTGATAALLTHSCTGALELATLLCGIGAGDEVILPSYTFSSTANAVVMRGATPVFVDIDPKSLNIDPIRVERAIGPRTKAVMPVHYAGVGADMDSLCGLADDAGLAVIEDAAQGLLATAGGRALGTIGTLGAVSFHETKNTTAGEGGALLINDADLIERAEILRTKGTNRQQFLRGHVDKYTWVDFGSSYGLSEINAAFLFAQLEQAERATRRRLDLWSRYHAGLAEAERAGVVARPTHVEGTTHNAHMYYVMLPTSDDRDRILRSLNAEGIKAVFHYIPLHSAPAGERYGRTSGDMTVTDDVSGRLLRLPMFNALTDSECDRVVEALLRAAG